VARTSDGAVNEEAGGLEHAALLEAAEVVADTCAVGHLPRPGRGRALDHPQPVHLGLVDGVAQPGQIVGDAPWPVGGG
jgi:hypothetical protein